MVDIRRPTRTQSTITTQITSFTIPKNPIPRTIPITTEETSPKEKIYYEILTFP